MSTLSPTLVEMLIGAIPPQDGAALVARVGERARMTSASGTVEVGSAALTAEVFDALSRRLLPQEQLETLQQTGSVEGQFVSPSGAGEFAVVASSMNDAQWIEVRRLGRTTTSSSPEAALPAPAAPSVDTLVADLMSRTRSKSATSTPSVRIAAQPAAPMPEPVTVAASAFPETSTPPLPIGSPDLDLTSSPGGSNDDLTIPTNFDFSQSKFDPDDLSVAETLVGEGAPSSSSNTAQSGSQVTKAPNVAPPPAATRTFSDRLSAYGKLSILLPAAILLGIGLPVVGWFGWTAYFPASQAPSPTTTPTPKPAALAVANVPQRAGVPMLQLRPRMPRVPMHAPSIPAPSIQFSAPVALTTVPAPVAAKEQSPTSLAPAGNDRARSGFSIQVAAVRERDEANRMVAKLVQQGYAGYVVNGEGAAAGFYRVRIGPFSNHDAADAVAKQIEQREGTTPWIVKETR